MKINLHTLASELAKFDNPTARNEDIIATETALAALGKKLRSVSFFKALSIIYAIFTRGGRRQKG